MQSHILILLKSIQQSTISTMEHLESAHLKRTKQFKDSKEQLKKIVLAEDRQVKSRTSKKKSKINKDEIKIEGNISLKDLVARRLQNWPHKILDNIKEQNLKGRKSRKKPRKNQIKPSLIFIPVKKRQNMNKIKEVSSIDHKKQTKSELIQDQKHKSLEIKLSAQVQISQKDPDIVCSKRVYKTPIRQKGVLRHMSQLMNKEIPFQQKDFYLKKQQIMKYGLPIGQGAKRALEKYQKDVKKYKNQQTYRNRFLRQQVKAGKDAFQIQKRKQIDNNYEQQSLPNTEFKYQEVEYQVKLQQPEIIKVRAQRRNLKGKVSKYHCTTEESIKILNAFSIDSGYYRGMADDLGYSVKKIRRHLKYQFNRALNIITTKIKQMGRWTKGWQYMERHEIIRQLHRSRFSNRLLSQQNVQFRKMFQRLMMTFNDPLLVVTDNDFNFLHRNIEAFIRGFCSNIRQKHHEVKIEQKESFDQNREYLIQGGYFLDKNKIRSVLKRESSLEPKSEILIYSDANLWTKEQEKLLCQLYVQHLEDRESIVNELIAVFGQKTPFINLENIDLKLNCLFKEAIYKLQKLTFNQDQKVKQQAQLSLSSCDKSKVIDQLNQFTKLVYTNKSTNVRSTQKQNSIFNDVPKLERRIIGHSQSFKARRTLINLLVKQFPPQQDIEQTIKAVQEFVEYAQNWQNKNFIIERKKTNKKHYF